MTDMFAALLTIWVAFFFPTIVAQFRGHPNWPAIAAVNILLGWTFIGWCVAMVWALTHFETKRSPTRYRRTARTH
jgi:hypothetical protein